MEDNGIGFDEKYRDRIFQIFQRLHGRNEYEGTGIGLAICRKIVDRHGGAIMATSTPGAGAKFIITLPRADARRIPNMNRSGKPITILYADDDAEDRMLVKDAWEESRLANELHFVEDGEELMRIPAPPRANTPN